MRHQHTEISSGKHKKRKSFVKPKQSSHKNVVQENHHVSSYNKKSFDPRHAHKNKDRCSSVEIPPMWGISVPVKKFQCKACQEFGHFTSLCYQKKQASFKSRRPKAHQLQERMVHAQEKAICGHSEDYSSSGDSFCLQIKVQHMQASLKKIPTPTHLITNLAYRLQPHHTRNQYLRARLDTCVGMSMLCPPVWIAYYLKIQSWRSLTLAIWRWELTLQTQSRLWILVNSI